MGLTAEICPICRKAMLDSESRAEFEDYPGIVFHAVCLTRVGYERAHETLAEVVATYDAQMGEQEPDDELDENAPEDDADEAVEDVNAHDASSSAA